MIGSLNNEKKIKIITKRIINNNFLNSLNNSVNNKIQSKINTTKTGVKNLKKEENIKNSNLEHKIKIKSIKRLNSKENLI